MKEAKEDGCSTEARSPRPWMQRFASARDGRFISTRTIVSINIFILLVNTYVLIMQLSQSNHLRTEEYFYSPITESQAARMHSVLRVFADAMRSANVTFFLCSGALLGTLRHHGRIPWDDDVDVIIFEEQRERMEAALRRLRPEYQLYKFHDWAALGKWKFFRSDSETFPLQPWSRFRWPYVDIFFVRQHNSSHMHHTYYGNVWFRMDEVFPLQQRPYDGVMLPTPCNATSFLKMEFQDPKFNASVCQSRGFSHILELPLPHWRQRSLSCSRLASRFPFVHSSVGDDGSVVEELRLGDRRLSDFSYKPAVCTGRP